MKKPSLFLTMIFTILGFILLGVTSGNVLADGTETLGDPSIPIASGTGIVAAGVGLQNAQPGTINIDVPGDVNQVLLYWGGTVTSDSPSDDTIRVNGVEVTGTLIGGQAFFFSAFGKEFYDSNYRADITDLGLVGSGANALTIDGLDNKDGDGNGADYGAGVLVIFNDGSTATDIQLKDGLDLAFDGFPEPRKTTVPQTFSFASADVERTANLVIFAGSVGEPDGDLRTSTIVLDSDAGDIPDVEDALASVDGDLWDTVTIPVTIPANATELTVQILSGSSNEGTPASLNWIGAGLSILPPPEPAMLGDFVWEDLNANGIQDPDELNDGINGVQVDLLCDADGDGNFDVVDTTTTANNPDNGLPGWYKFNVTPGVACKVTFVNPDPDGPDAYMFSPRQVGGDPAIDSDGPMSDPVTLGPGEFDPTLDAGLFRKGSIHVFGYLDDGDGVYDPNTDSAFPDDPGKTFELLDQNGDVINSDTTMDGMVWFEGLTPGTYGVRENPVPDGYTLTTLPNERTFTIISGQELVYEDGAAMLPDGDQRFETNVGDDLRWGNTPIPEPAMLGDFVWEDLNANGIQDADELDDGINGVQVDLLCDADGDGNFDVVNTTTTSNNPDNGLPGWYKFNVTPGVACKVTFINPDPDGPDAYMFSPRQVGGNPAVDSDGPMSDPVTLGPGEFDPTLDAGLFRKGSIHVFGYLDEDGDGNFDPEDEAFPDNPGKTFELLDQNGDVIKTETTMDGMVWFEGLTPGTYGVRENPVPDGFTLTTLPNARRFTIISGEELVYEDGAAMLPDGDQRFETNLGDDLRWGNSEVVAMLGDFVWEDLNANGIQDPDELDDGINGVQVDLLCDADNDGNFDVVDTTTTANNPDGGLPGWYKFNVTPGVACKVTFINPDPDGPDAYMFSPRQVGGNPAVDSDGPMSDPVTLGPGEFDPTLDAGLFRKGSIHVFGYLDEDGDGNFDPEDEAFPDDPGKTFELLDENGNVQETQTTMDGMVWFEQLVPGTYTVRENPVPANYELTTLPNERTFTIVSGQELVYEDGAAMLPDGDQRFETNVGDDLRWGNTSKLICNLLVDKKCVVTPPPTEDLLCSDKIVATTWRYTGSGPLANVTIEADKGPSRTYPTVNPGDVLTSPAENDFTIDARPDEDELGSKTNILVNGVLTEIIHTSCSAIYEAGQPAPLDGGSPAVPGNPDPDKGDPSPNWFVENFVDKDSPNIVAVPQPPAPADACAVTLGGVPSCETEEGRPNNLTFEVTGGTCDDSDNTQGDKFKCTDVGSIDPNQPVDIVYTGKDPDKITVDPASVAVGGQFTLEATGRDELHSNSKLEIFQNGALKQQLEIHTSCSAPLEVGDVFGSVKLLKYNGKGAGAEVTYHYDVTNLGDPLTSVSVFDIPLGSIGTIPLLGTGESQTFMTTTEIDQTITNLVLVNGLRADGEMCMAQDEVTVTVEEPPPGPQICTTKVQAMKLKYTGTSSLTDVEFDPDKGASVTYATVNPGDILTMPAQNDWTIDATVSGEEELGSKTKILVDGVETEMIHTSCSAPFASGAPAPLDGGSPGVPGNPDPDKGDPSPNWFVESFTQKP